MESQKLRIGMIIMKTSSNSKIYPLVSVDWLNNHLNDSEILVFDASMDKVTSDTNASEELQIPNAQFFDIKNVFSDISAPFPSTVPSEELFIKEAQKLGVNSDSRIVVYDDKGIYSSARVWYLFRAFGFNNIAVLDGGLPKWKAANYPLKTKSSQTKPNGNFIAHYDSEKFKFFNDIQKSSINKHHLIIDARSENRFKGIEPEPRKGLRSGLIPNSVNIPFSNLLVDGQCFKSKEEIQKEFDAVNTNNEHLVFSCGTGITACVLALGAELIGKSDVSVYDGSWTEYGSLTTE
ncbi:MAG: thiosulfate/3-mercaptopyruvate sulfurtransferase [Glaciecola sp.]